MPCFEAPISNKQLLCGCMVDVARDQGEQHQLHKYVALIDTGATGCCISSHVVKELNLISNQTSPTIGVHGQQESKIYRIAIGLFTTIGIQQQEITETTPTEQQYLVNAQVLNNVYASEFNNSHQPFDVIIGMDYLSICTLIVSTGKFTICF